MRFVGLMQPARRLAVSTHSLAGTLALAVLVIGLIAGLPAATASAQDWATKMFTVTKHDFGNVPRGGKAQFRFQFKNLYEEDVHVAGVRSSCGCTTPQIVKPDLKTFETGEIVADFNTKSFLGFKSATLTVTFDKPFYAEVPLQINGFIRSDVVLQPGEVDFGAVDLGASAEKRVLISYAGRDDWSLVSVKGPDESLETQLVETGRARGRVTYELIVRLSEKAPPGYLKEQLTLVTNDARNPEIPLDVEARLVSEITVSPAALFMGVVQPGQTVTKQLIVRGKRPFKIMSIKCDDASFEVTAGAAAKAVHVLPIVFTAGEKEGKILQQIGIETDQGATPTFTAYAQVVGDSQPKLARQKAGSEEKSAE